MKEMKKMDEWKLMDNDKCYWPILLSGVKKKTDLHDEEASIGWSLWRSHWNDSSDGNDDEGPGEWWRSQLLLTKPNDQLTVIEPLFSIIIIDRCARTMAEGLTAGSLIGLSWPMT